MKRKNPFQRGGNEKMQTTTVIFIEATHGGLLTKMMRYRELRMA